MSALAVKKNIFIVKVRAHFNQSVYVAMNISGMLKQTLHFYQDFYNRTDLKQAIFKLIEELKDSFSDIIRKCTNLAQTNFDLGLFHYTSCNLSDAILRFRMAMFFEPAHYIEANYYLGRCYYEQYKYDKAADYIQKYIDSGDKAKSAEAAFLLSVINGKTSEIKNIPKSIIQAKANQVASVYIKHFKDHKQSPMVPEQEQQFTLLNQYLLDSSKPTGNNVLDIGCAFGTMGRLCRIHNIATMLTGVDIAEKMVDIAAKLTENLAVHEHIVVYHKTQAIDIYQYFLEFLQLNIPKFDLLLAFDFITCNSDLENLFIGTSTISKDDAILALTFKSSKGEAVEFNDKLEQFSYTPEFVISNASKSSWKLAQEYDISFIGAEQGKLMIFCKNLKMA